MLNPTPKAGQPRQAVFCTYHRVNKIVDYGKYRDEKRDLIIVKEKWIDEDNNVQRRIRCVENFERPFWITKKQFRKHKDKREWAPLEEVDMFRAPQWDLSRAVQKALGEYHIDPDKQIRMVNRSPYVYGTDCSPTYFVKEAYTHKFNGFRAGPANVCWLDIETDVIGVEERIILLSLVYQDKCIVYSLKDFISRTTVGYEQEFYRIWGELEEQLKQNKHYKVNYQLSLKVFDHEIDLLKSVFDQLHRWKPDYISGWNIMGFDQDKIVQRLKRFGEEPMYYFSDPMIPKMYKNFMFKEGKKFAVSDSGKKTNLRPIARWHEIIAPASFQWIDEMCVYYQLRKHNGMEPSYKLDAILEKEIGLNKYEIPEAQDKRGLNKHIFMQREFPVHYAVYNAFDSIGLDMMDLKLGDIRNTFGVMLDDSDYKSFQSNPSKLVDSFESYLRRQKGMVIGSTADSMFTSWDKELPPLDGWITALPTSMLDDEVGMNVVQEWDGLKSKFCNHNGDNDIISSYPLGGIFNNLSRMTTEIEVTGIEGVSMPNRYRLGLNMMAGCINAVSNARIVHGVYDFTQVSDVFDECYAEFKQSQ